ncbi:hypothetical protein DAI22_11g218400 [Oryza sativa Japonica Group]|nr:hypothetical protein DAI22_11g218400 [Oryza sativa Japonica Group]
MRAPGSSSRGGERQEGSWRGAMGWKGMELGGGRRWSAARDRAGAPRASGQARQRVTLAAVGGRGKRKRRGRKGEPVPCRDGKGHGRGRGRGSPWRHARAEAAGPGGRRTPVEWNGAGGSRWGEERERKEREPADPALARAGRAAWRGPAGKRRPSRRLGRGGTRERAGPGEKREKGRWKGGFAPSTLGRCGRQGAQGRRQRLGVHGTRSQAAAEGSRAAHGREKSEGERQGGERCSWEEGDGAGRRRLGRDSAAQGGGRGRRWRQAKGEWAQGRMGRGRPDEEGKERKQAEWESARGEGS